MRRKDKGRDPRHQENWNQHGSCFLVSVFAYHPGMRGQQPPVPGGGEGWYWTVGDQPRGPFGRRHEAQEDAGRNLHDVGRWRGKGGHWTAAYRPKVEAQGASEAPLLTLAVSMITEVQRSEP